MVKKVKNIKKKKIKKYVWSTIKIKYLVESIVS
jgi:hypothetical protein